MGDDDRNEGHRPGECPAHTWTALEVMAAREGAYVERTCGHCGAVVVVTPDELGGWV